MDKLTDIKGNWNRSSTWAEYGVLTLAALVYVFAAPNHVGNDQGCFAKLFKAFEKV